MFELTLKQVEYACYSPIPDCELMTEDEDAILAAAQVHIPALVHQQGANVTGAKQKPPKINYPSISRASSEELWANF